MTIMETISSFFQPRVKSSEEMVNYISNVMTHNKNSGSWFVPGVLWSILVVSESAKLKDAISLFNSDKLEYPRTIISNLFYCFSVDNFVGSLMNWSLSYNLIDVKAFGNSVQLLLSNSKDGSTNIDADVIEALSILRGE